MKNRWVIIAVFPILVACEFRSPRNLKDDLLGRTEIEMQQKRTKLPLSLFDEDSIKDFHYNKIIHIGEYPFIVNSDSIHNKTGNIKLVFKYEFALLPTSEKSRRVAIKTPEKGAQECLPRILSLIEKRIGRADNYIYSKLPDYDTLRIGAQWKYLDGNINLFIIPSDVAMRDSIGNMIYTSDIVINIKKRSTENRGQFSDFQTIKKKN